MTMRSLPNTEQWKSTDGKLTLWLASGTGHVKVSMVLSFLNEVAPNRDDNLTLGAIADRFFIAEAFVRDYESVADQHPLVAYLSHRHSYDLEYNWTIFQQMVTVDELNLLLQAYNDTRAETETSQKKASLNSDDGSSNGTEPNKTPTRNSDSEPIMLKTVTETS